MNNSSSFMFLLAKTLEFVQTALSNSYVILRSGKIGATRTK